MEEVLHSGHVKYFPDAYNMLLLKKDKTTYAIIEAALYDLGKWGPPAENMSVYWFAFKLALSTDNVS